MIELKDAFKEDVSDLNCERLEQLKKDLQFSFSWTYRHMPKTQFDRTINRLIEMEKELTRREFVSPIDFGVGHE
jgi:hypothetical protein